MSKSQKIILWILAIWYLLVGIIFFIAIISSIEDKNITRIFYSYLTINLIVTLPLMTIFYAIKKDIK